MHLYFIGDGSKSKRGTVSKSTLFLLLCVLVLSGCNQEKLSDCFSNPMPRSSGGTGNQKSSSRSASSLGLQSFGESDLTCLSEKPHDLTHIRYFGPFDNGAPEESEAKETLETETTYSNLIWVKSLKADYIDRIRSLISNANKPIKLIVPVEWYFFNTEGKMLPEQQYKSNWNTVVAALQPIKDYLVAFYVRDEPFRHTKEVVSSRSVPWNQIVSETGIANKIIKSSFPNVARAITFSPGEIRNEKFEIPDDVNWLGMDCYDNWDDCHDNLPVPWFLLRLKSKITKRPSTNLGETQEIFLVPQGFVWKKHNSGSKLEKAIKYINFNLERQFQLAQTEPLVTAILPFSMQDYEGLNGYAHFPEIHKKIKEIGSKIVNQDH